jgi:hypothetical protein
MSESKSPRQRICVNLRIHPNAWPVAMINLDQPKVRPRTNPDCRPSGTAFTACSLVKDEIEHPPDLKATLSESARAFLGLNFSGR